MDGIVGVIDTYIASSDAMERLTVPTTNLTNGYVVATKELRAEAIELLDSIIDTVDSEIDKGELDDEAISFLDMVIRPLLVRLRDLISSHYGDDEGVEEAKVESSTTIGNLIRLTDFGRATKSKIGGASGALVRIAAVGDALEKTENTWFKPFSSVEFLQPFAVGRKRRMCMAKTSRDPPTPVPGVADQH